MENDNKNKKDSPGCVVFGVLGLLAMALWFIEGFISSGGEASGGFNEISNELSGWVIFVVVAIIVYGFYDMMKGQR